MKISKGSTSVDAIPFYVSPGLVSGIMPPNAPLGADTLILSYNGNSTEAPVNVASSVGLFAINSGGFGRSVLQNFVNGAFPINSKSVAATPGQTLILYGTGLGAALNPDNQPPRRGTWRSPCCSGLDQFAFTVPVNVPLGCNVPIVIRTNNAISRNVVTAAISAVGKPCSDAVAPFGNVTGATKSGSVVLLHTNIGSDVGTIVSSDFVQASFRKEVGVNPIFSPPPRA